MKEATGELNMTIVTVIAIAAILAFAVAFVPRILTRVNEEWEASDQEGDELRNQGTQIGQGTGA